MPATLDPFDLDRFLQAQAAVWPAVQAELRAGAKRSHWMWFVFPQLTGLGRSGTAQRFALGGAAEALAYLDHSVLGPRLAGCTALVLQHAGRPAAAIFGPPDDAKFRSSMTLFAAVRPGDAVFAEALARFFAGRPDAATLALLGR